MPESAIYAKNIKTNYENFIALCPKCEYKNIFNRISDLKTIQPITSKIVLCLNENCGEAFGINGDRIQTKYLGLLFDCYSLKKEKRYSICVILLAQALEVFFYHYLRVELAYRPYWKENRRDSTRVNSLLDSLQSAIKYLAYGKLKNVFLNWVISESEISCLDDSNSRISNIERYSKSLPAEEDLRGLPNSKLANLLIMLRTCDIDELRNKVVHKEAYLPNCEEVETAIKEVRELLVKISYHLDVYKEDIYSYR